jgi:hypothetical protein
MHKLAVLSLAGSMVVGAQTRALACSRAAPILHVIDIALAATDTSAPSTPDAVSAEVVRTLGKLCDGDSCIQSTCGDTATVVVRFTLSTDDQSGPTQIGYQLIAAEGKMLPDALKAGATIANVAPLTPTSGMLQFSVDFDAAVELDTSAQLVAIDAAGNPSAASAPFAIQFDGCTHPVNDETSCVEDEKQSCSFSPKRAPGSWLALLAASGLLLGARYRRSWRLRRMAASCSEVVRVMR